MEATSFTISEPTEKNLIHPLLLDALPCDIVETVRQEFDLKDFQIENISLERIFCDKLLAAEFYVEREEYFDVAKHIYDIVTMVDMPRIQKMIKDETAFINYLSYKRIEETLRIGSDLSCKPFRKFKLFDNVLYNNKFETAFEEMQRKYTFQHEYYIDVQNARAIIGALKNRLTEIDGKEQEQLKSYEFKNRLEEYNPGMSNNMFFSDEGIK